MEAGPFLVYFLCSFAYDGTKAEKNARLWPAAWMAGSVVSRLPVNGREITARNRLQSAEVYFNCKSASRAIRACQPVVIFSSCTEHLTRAGFRSSSNTVQSWWRAGGLVGSAARCSPANSSQERPMDNRVLEFVSKPHPPVQTHREEQPKNARAMLQELYLLLEDYSPVWYTKERHVDAAVRALRGAGLVGGRRRDAIKARSRISLIGAWFQPLSRGCMRPAALRAAPIADVALRRRNAAQNSGDAHRPLSP